MAEVEISRAGAERIDDVAWRFYERLGLVPYLRLTIGRVPPPAP